MRLHLPLLTSVDFAHLILSERLETGDFVVDATAGNGHDTVFLASRVGSSGHVFAFDVQPEAINSTHARLLEAELIPRCTLIHASHESMAQHLPTDWQGQIAAVMFNLGWLPGHDKACITRPSSTLAALKTALEWLRPGGVLTVVAYPGHTGGDDEAEQVGAWMAAQPSHQYEVRLLRPTNRQGKSPECWVLRIRAETI